MSIAQIDRNEYRRLSHLLAQAEAEIRPQIAALEASKVAPLRAKLEELADRIGDEPIGRCEGCGVLLFCEDNYASDPESGVIGCWPCVSDAPENGPCYSGKEPSP